MAQQTSDTSKDSRFKEQVSDEDKVPAVNQQASSTTGIHNQQAPALDQPTPSQPTPVQPTPAQPTPIQPTPTQPTPDEAATQVAESTSDVPVIPDNGLTCKVCCRLRCVCPSSSSYGATQMLSNVNFSSASSQGPSGVPSGVPSAPQHVENVSPTNTHIQFDFHTAAQQRADDADDALQQALRYAIEAHVALVLAQNKANSARTATTEVRNQANNALQVARTRVSRDDLTLRDRQADAISAHVALYIALQRRPGNQGLHSDVQQTTSQDVADEEKDTRSKGKEKVDNTDSSANEQKEPSTQSKGKGKVVESGSRPANANPSVAEQIKRLLSQFPPQKPSRSQSESALPSPNPLHKARTTPPPPLVKSGRLGRIKYVGAKKNASSTTTGRRMSDPIGGSGVDHLDGTRDGHAGESSSSQEDGAKKDKSGDNDGNDDGTGAREGSGATPPGGNGTTLPGGNGTTLPGGNGTTLPGGSGKKRGPLRRMSSDFWNKVTKKKK